MATKAKRKSFLDRFQGRKYLTSVEFMKVWNHYVPKGQQTLRSVYLDKFVGDLFKSTKSDEASEEEIEQFKQDVLGMFDSNNNGVIELTELALILPIGENFLVNFRNNHKLTSVQFMEIWNAYDSDGNGSVEAVELEGFLRDLLEKENQEVTPIAIAEYKDTLLELYDKDGNGKIEFDELASILSLEENFLRKFKARGLLTPEEFADVWQHYDADGNGSIEDSELDAFLRDLMDRQGQPYSAEDLKDYKEGILEMCDSNKNGKIEIEELQKVLPVNYEA